MKKSRLTHIAFCPADPVIIVGDDRGGVNCLKMSPNLRKAGNLNPGQTKQQAETEKMTKIIDMVRASEISQLN